MFAGLSYDQHVTGSDQPPPPPRSSLSACTTWIIYRFKQVYYNWCEHSINGTVQHLRKIHLLTPPKLTDERARAEQSFIYLLGSTDSCRCLTVKELSHVSPASEFSFDLCIQKLQIYKFVILQKLCTTNSDTKLKRTDFTECILRQ